MVPAINPDLHPLIRKLDSIFDLTAEERHGITKLPVIIRDLKADQDIVRDGDRPSQCCLILDGFAFRYKALQGGKRQIFSFHISGDMPDVQSLHLAVMDHAISTLTASKVAFIRHDTVRALLHKHPRIGDAFWRDTLINAAVFREWLVGVGRRSAPTRIAHLFCEMFLRMRTVGLADGDTCDWPVTQAEIADALGLSTVHVNRSIMALRDTGTVDIRKGKLIVKDWQGLQAAGEFDPTYLHLKPPPARRLSRPRRGASAGGLARGVKKAMLAWEVPMACVAPPAGHRPQAAVGGPRPAFAPHRAAGERR